MFMRKLLMLLAGLAVLLSSCEKEREQDVMYRITNSSSGFMVSYSNEVGTLVRETVVTQSAQDIWTYSFQAEEGDVVFVSARYKDINSAITVQLFLNGKIFKEKSSISDTITYVTVSGTIPY
jgi:hypothetical protein